MTEISIRECARQLLAQDDILILNHLNPDGDTLGSSAALCSALRRLGKRAFIYNNPQVTEKFLPYTQEFFAPEDFEPKYIAAVDLAAEGLFPKGFYGSVQLCIDHHPSNTGYAEKLLLNGKRSSCGEIVLDVIKNMGIKPNKKEATLLYIALTTDCGCFRYSNTNARTLSSASELLKLGADIERVNQEFFRRVSRARLCLEGRIYSEMRFFRGGKIALVTVTDRMLEECGATENDCDNLASLPGRLEGAELGITIRETADGGSKVSVRSGHEVSASDICAVLGGGGHAMAAGCRLSCDVKRAEEMLLAVIDEVWK